MNSPKLCLETAFLWLLPSSLVIYLIVLTMPQLSSNKENISFKVCPDCSTSS